MDRTSFSNAREGGAVAAQTEVVALREQIGLVLWETVEATFAEGKKGKGKGEAEGEGPAPPRAPMLLLRLKAL